MSILPYLIKTTLVSGLFFLIYYVALRKLSFFSLNRFYLLGTLIFAYTFPFINVSFIVDDPVAWTIIPNIQESVNQFTFFEELPTVEQTTSTTSPISNNYRWWALALISSILFFRFLKHLIQLNKTIRAHEKLNFSNYILVLFNHQNTFSFFRYIFISQDVWHSSQNEKIINHELSHIKHRHSFDRVFIELMLIVFWMNPFLYLYRKAIEEVHEFQADSDAVDANTSKHDYFDIVLQQAGQQNYSPLMSPFSYKLIKKRIQMSTHKSNPLKRALLIIPIALGILIIGLSSTDYIKQSISNNLSITTDWPINKAEASQLFEGSNEALLNNGAIEAGNVFTVLINSTGIMLMEGEIATIDMVKPAVIDFLSNNNTYPEKIKKNIDLLGDIKVNVGVISLQRDVATPNEAANDLLKEVVGAYSDVRDNSAKRYFGKDFSACNGAQKEAIVQLHPRRISFNEPKDINFHKKSVGSFIKPINKNEKYEISSGYGMRMHPIKKEKMMHRGIDYKAELNTKVVAIADGTVRKIQLDHKPGKGYGKYIIIDHENGFSSLYAQLNAYNVKEGQKVKQGDHVAFVGSTGQSTGPHLHFELKKDGEYVDPDKYIK